MTTRLVPDKYRAEETIMSPTVIALRAPNDGNGQPRQFYAVFYGKRLSALYEAGNGGPPAVLRRALGDDGPALIVNITIGEYQRLRQLHEIPGRATTEADESDPGSGITLPIAETAG